MKLNSLFISLLVLLLFSTSCQNTTDNDSYDLLKASFINPPDAARPGVYWYFMDGNLSREAMTADLESMKEAGIGNLVFLEVNVGVPRGTVDFLSEEWQNLFAHAVKEAERLGIAITMGVGPGWTGSGGPWVKLDQSMQHLVASSTMVSGSGMQNILLEVPAPRKPFFGEGGLTPKMLKQWNSYYEDVKVLAFPSPSTPGIIKDIDEKAIYYRSPYTSMPGVKPFLPAPAVFPELSASAVIEKEQIIDVTEYLKADGSFSWDVPEGNWTIMRFVTRNNGAVTRPAPEPGLGFESDKFSAKAFDEHFDAFLGKLIEKTGPPKVGSGAGWTMLHMDSWEMGAQNWTQGFQEEFQSRRGYDPLPYLPTFTGNIVGSMELSERFLWDLRITSQELILENHVGRIKELGKKYGFGLSIEPYDMNPTADLDMGSMADVPMCEFWSLGYGFNSSFSCFESASIAHVYSRPVVAAEAFTAVPQEAWLNYPGAVKNQGDWAFTAGINRFVYHTFAHQPLREDLRPGMTMGPYGVHWDRGQTWWTMSSDYHRYITRCSHILQQGRTVADVLYLTPEGAPHVFRPPPSALIGNDTIPDRRAYNFDGCSPLMLISDASVKDNKIVFPGGASYELLVLSSFNTMTPDLLKKIESLLKEGARIVGSPPLKSPSLVNYPECDQIVSTLAEEIWGGREIPEEISTREYAKGKIFWGKELKGSGEENIYPHYDITASILKEMGVEKDFQSSGSLRYTHRTMENMDVYFVSNRTDESVETECIFRVDQGRPELWDPITGETRILPDFNISEGLTSIPLKFESHQSFFIVFTNSNKEANQSLQAQNFPELKSLIQLEGSWDVSFDTIRGGPEKVVFENLEDWTQRPEEGIKYYSGIASYYKSFNLPENQSLNADKDYYLDLGEVYNMARIILNGKDLGVLWTTPWHVNISSALKAKDNQLEIQLVNLWPNRLIGDSRMPYDGIKNGKWPEWILEDKARPSNRYSFTPFGELNKSKQEAEDENFIVSAFDLLYNEDSPLLESGLIGPVKINCTKTK